MQHHDNVDAYLACQTTWVDETVALRSQLLGCDLDELIKWGKPCYAHGGDNICIIQPFKGFLALLYFKGVLLEDAEGLLEEQGENTHSARRLTFRSVDDVVASAEHIRDFVKQAIAHEQAGTPLPERPELELVAELVERLEADAKLKAAFEGLTPGRQREYHLHISGAKQSKTRANRVEKFIPRILAGKGMRDR